MRTSALRPWLRQLRAEHFEAECARQPDRSFNPDFRPLIGMSPGRAQQHVEAIERGACENLGRIILPAWAIDELDQAGYVLAPGFLDLARLQAQASEWRWVHDPGDRFANLIRDLKAAPEGVDGEPLVTDRHLAAAKVGTYSNMLEPVTADEMRAGMMRVLAGARMEPKP